MLLSAKRNIAPAMLQSYWCNSPLHTTIPLLYCRVIDLTLSYTQHYPDCVAGFIYSLQIHWLSEFVTSSMLDYRPRNIYSLSWMSLANATFNFKRDVRNKRSYRNRFITHENNTTNNNNKTNIPNFCQLKDRYIDIVQWMRQLQALRNQFRNQLGMCIDV